MVKEVDLEFAEFERDNNNRRGDQDSSWDDEYDD